MDILENNFYNNINGFIISENTYLNKGKIFRVYTDEFGLIPIYSKIILKSEIKIIFVSLKLYLFLNKGAWPLAYKSYNEAIILMENSIT